MQRYLGYFERVYEDIEDSILEFNIIMIGSKNI